MDEAIFVLLAQDGLTNSAVYVLLAAALVMVFAVTRVIFLPQGEFLAWGALTMVALESGHTPGTVWLLVGMGGLTFLQDLILAHRRHRRDIRALTRSALWHVAYPAILAGLLFLLPVQRLPQVVQVVLTLAVIIPLGPMVYRLAFQPVADASILVLLIAAVAVHLSMVGLGLLMFGPEGGRTAPFSDSQIQVGGLLIGGHALAVLGVSAAMMAGLYLLFHRTLYGKALRAAAVNRNGARLMGISPVLAGRMTFLLAASIGGLSGVLLAPLSTVYYDSGFLIGLKGFVAAIIGGLGDYLLATGGALLVGQLESFASFWTSAFKDVLVFTLIIPVLMWRSLRSHPVEEDE